MELTCDANFLVIASGELQEQVFNDDETKKTFYYRFNVPTLAQGISMAVGPFEVLPDPKIGYVTHFCLPGKMKQLLNCVSFFHQVRSGGSLLRCSEKDSRPP
jgi:transcription initiation factor TFIID subunit 2